jgi:hypothetical protein
MEVGLRVSSPTRLLNNSRERNNPTKTCLKDDVAPFLLEQSMPALSVDSAPILPLQSTAPLRLKVAPGLPDRHVFQRWFRWKTLFLNTRKFKN